MMFSVISYNVMFNNIYFIERHQQLLKLLKANSPDVICLQEVLRAIVPTLIHELDDYQPVSTTLLPVGREYGEMIFVKKDLVIVSGNYIEIPTKMGRAILYAQIEKDNVEYNILTFHLESLNNKTVRAQQLEIMWDYVRQLDNVICCGDTNQTAKERVVIPEGYLDAWKQTDGDIGRYTYYSHRFWDGDRKQRYDKCWYSVELELMGFGILGNKLIDNRDDLWISDHDGLYCVFSTASTPE